MGLMSGISAHSKHQSVSAAILALSIFTLTQSVGCSDRFENTDFAVLSTIGSIKALSISAFSDQFNIVGAEAIAEFFGNSSDPGFVLLGIAAGDISTK